MSPWLHWYTAHRHAVMFYSLLLVISGGAVFRALGWSPLVFQALVAANLVAVTVDPNPGAIRRAALIAVLAAIAIAGVSDTIAYARGVSLALLLWSVLAFVGVVGVVRFALARGHTRAEHVYAGVSVYLVAGLYLGVVYHVLDTAAPGSFLVMGEPSTGLSLDRTIYFSFVTIATLGYGDIVPNTDVTRGLAILEAVTGQLYVAVLIARLVGSFAVQRESEER